MNTPVSFEIAKLLKEKGFDNKTYKSYRISINPDRKIADAIPDKITYFPNVKESIAAPTISEVVMWLYEKHKIWIGVELTDNTRDFYFQPTIWTSKDREFHDEGMIDQAKSICEWREWRYTSPTEAYTAAIEYTLTKLI